jgi:hypothetical protein
VLIAGAVYLAADCLPLPGFYEFLDLTLHQVALQSADVADVELSVEVIGFVKEGAGEKLLTGFFIPFAVDVLRTNRHILAAGHLFAKLWDGETTFTSSLTTLDMNDLGIRENEFGVGVFLKGDVDDARRFDIPI